MGSELRIYRIVRQYPFRNQNELYSPARKLHDQYGDDIMFYDGISSKAYSSVIEKNESGSDGAAYSIRSTYPTMLPSWC